MQRCWGRGRAAAGGGAGSSGSAPRRKGRGGCGQLSASQTRRREQRGWPGCGTGRLPAAPSQGPEQAHRQRSHVRGPSSRTPPPRAALSIHKFSAGSAATELQSQPGVPCVCRLPSRRPWAARPGAEVGAAGPGALDRAGTGGRMRAARGWWSAPGPALAHRAIARGSGEGAERGDGLSRPVPRQPSAARRGIPPLPTLGLSLP